jgi:hypothetical protein
MKGAFYCYELDPVGGLCPMTAPFCPALCNLLQVTFR